MLTNLAKISSHCSPPRARGVTLIELLVAITVLAVLLGIAAPSFTLFIVSNRLTTQANELVADLTFARSEAGARGQTVRLCAAASSTSCSTSGTSWATGRIVWVDSNSNGALDSGNNEIIKYAPALDGNLSLTSSGFTSTVNIAYQPHGGLSPATSGTFTLCSPGESKGRQISVPFTGRAVASRIETCS